MDTKEVKTDRFSDTHEQAVETLRWRGVYDSLISKLGELGTEVKRHRTLEHDKGIAPHSFVRHATHEFVFPPQEGLEEEDNSGVIDPTPGYELHREDVAWDYDKPQVKGHVQVNYDDSDGRVTFSVSDVMGESELSDGVLREIDQIEPVGPTPTPR